MFYSHEVLTSRKHGVATVWLVATLGSKSTLKKVDRKELVAVNIPKACETIVSPEAPMALRLQSNLLYGVTRVYGEQCNYVLKDAQMEQNRIRALMCSVRAAALTELESKHRAKPDQLTLQDDPNFILDFAWGMDFDPFHSDLDLTTVDSSQQSSLLSPHRAASSALGSEHVDPALGNLVIPPSLSPSIGGAPAFTLGGSVTSERHTQIPKEEGLLDDLGFTFDAEGYMVEEAPREMERAPSVHTPMPTLRDNTLPVEGYNDQQMEDVLGYEDNGHLPVGHEYDMQDVQPFPARNQQADLETVEPAAADAEVVESSETAVSAPAQRVRRTRILQPDTDLELHNRDLTQWNEDYLDHMQALTQQKMQHRAVRLARENAEFWVLQNGVGGLGTFFGQDTMPEPLRMFRGNNLIEAITGLRLNVAGEKHARDRDGDVEEVAGNDRRVRARSDETRAEAEIGRGDGDDTRTMDDAGGNFVDVGDETMEMGREGPTPLAEHASSVYPWNPSLSARGSSLQRSQAPFSAGGIAASSAGGPAPFVGRIRTVSASPLIGRGRTESTGEPLGMGDHQLLSDEFEFGDSQGQQPNYDNDFELFGAAAAVDTQTAGSNTWLRKALDLESGNFFSFVQAGIADADTAREMAGDDRSGKVGFDRLLPSTEHNRIVAAQGLLHVLTLATKNLLRAEQSTAFGPINMHLL